MDVIQERVPHQVGARAEKAVALIEDNWVSLRLGTTKRFLFPEGNTLLQVYGRGGPESTWLYHPDCTCSCESVAHVEEITLVEEAIGFMRFILCIVETLAVFRMNTKSLACLQFTWFPLGFMHALVICGDILKHKHILKYLHHWICLYRSSNILATLV